MKKLLSMMLLSGICLFGCSNVNEVEDTENPVQESPVVEETEKMELPIVGQHNETPVTEEPIVETPEVEENRGQLGDTIYITTSSGDYELTFTNAYYTDERNEYSTTMADKVIMLEYEYKNISYEDEYMDGLFVCEGVDYKVYDGDGYLLETYPVTLTFYQDSVSKNRSSKGSEAFAVIGDQTHYEIEVANSIIEFDLE